MMAYITKAEVKAKSEKLKAINKKYGMKATFSGSNSSTLLLTIGSGSIDFEAECVLENYKTSTATDGSFYVQCNHYYLDRHWTGKALEYLEECYALMLEGHYDRSDIQTDYFECSWYNNIHIGRWNRGYVVTES
jgi:hypothetical protein